MAELISINKLNMFEYSGGGLHNPSPIMDKPVNGDSVVRIDFPQSTDNSTVNENGLKRSPTIASFHSRRAPVNVEWKNITLTTKKGKTILNDVSGAVYGGELTAIMGPSGTGKTSLLNVLSGISCMKVSGQILVNGVSRDMRIFRKLSCYILQDDHILPRLTVREIITVAANLKIPTSVPKQKKQAAIDECIKALGLEAHQNQKANQLSGGQRKRLCIAQELVSNPPLVFLDEPTSGLDSSSCLQCIQLLKYLAEEGRTIICTIHQPSSKIFENFDKLYMLAEGQCIYRGPAQHLVPFLAEQGLNCPQYHNPTDFVTEVAIGVYGDWNWRLKKAIDSSGDLNYSSSRICLLEINSKQDLNLQSSANSLLENKVTDKSSIKEMCLEDTYRGYATSSFNQFQVLFRRNFFCILREPMNTYYKLFGNIGVGLLFGLAFYDIGNDASKVYNNTGLLFCVAALLIFTAKIPTILTFPLLRTIFEREHMNSWYSASMYYLAISISEIPFQILFPLVNCSIIYWMTGQPSEMFRFSLFLITAVIISIVSQAIGQLIGSGSSIQNGIYVASMIATPSLLFCGFLLPINNIPVYLRWLSYISYGRYTFQSFMLTVYSMDRPFLYCNKTMCPFEDPEVIIKEFQLEGDLYVDFAALFGFFLTLKIVTYLILKFRVARII